MITNAIITVLQGVINILLAPLTVLNIAVDFIGSIPIVVEFLQVVAYVLPWTNLLPLFGIVIAGFIFRFVLALIKLVWHFIPIFGN
jgi:hypothetical protein